MSKRDREDDVPDPLIEALRARDAVKDMAVKAFLDEHYPDPPIANVCDTVKRIEDAILLAETNREDQMVAVYFKVFAPDDSYTVPVEWIGDKWWESICEWDATQLARSKLDTQHSVGKAMYDAIQLRRTVQNKSIVQLLSKTWLDKHPRNTRIQWIYKHLHVSVGLK